MAYSHDKRDDSSETDATTGGVDTGKFSMEGRQSTSFARIHGLFNEADRRYGLQSQRNVSRTRTSNPTTQSPFHRNGRQIDSLFSGPTNPRALSRYLLNRVVLSPEKELEILMGSVFRVGSLANVFGKESSLNRIMELLSVHEKLREYKSPSFRGLTIMEVAIKNNTEGKLDSYIKAMKRMGCVYAIAYEKELPGNRNKHNNFSAGTFVDEPTSDMRLRVRR